VNFLLNLTSNLKTSSNKIVEYLTIFAKLFIKFIKKYWFYILIVGLVLLFFFESMISIITGTIFAIGLITYYLVTSNFKYTLINFMNNYQVIEDRQIAEEMSVPLEDVRKYMRIIATKQKNNQGIVVCLKTRCIFYNLNLIEDFIDLYNTGFNEKNILNSLIQKYSIKSRAEIKGIEDALIEQERIEERDLSKIKLLPFESDFTKK